MLKKLILKIKKVILYYKNPKYVIIKGVSNGNRAIMVLGARPLKKSHQVDKDIRTHGYATDIVLNHTISYENQKDLSWYKSNIYLTIWSFKELLYWRRLLPNNGYKCLEYKNGKWNKIN